MEKFFLKLTDKINTILVKQEVKFSLFDIRVSLHNLIDSSISNTVVFR